MRLLITGGAGFIGTTVTKSALEQGYVVHNLDKLGYASNEDNLIEVADNSNYSFSKCDLADSEHVEQIVADFKPERVMHLAAESHVDKSIDNPAPFIQSNIVGTFNILESLRRCWTRLNMMKTARFLHVSTDEVFGSLGAEGFFTETTAYDPQSPYSASKAASDHLVRSWGNTFGMPILVTNCSNNYGPHQFAEKLIPVVILNALAGEAIPIYGNGDNIRDWLHVEDHARALFLVLENGTPGDTFNIGGNHEISNLDLVRRICKLLDHIRPKDTPHEELIEFVFDRPGHDKRYAIDNSKIRDIMGWEPAYSFEQGLEMTVKWYIDRQNSMKATERQGLGAH